MANGTTVKECEFKKECEEVYGPNECIFSDKEHCRYMRFFAILVHNQAIEKVIGKLKEMEGGALLDDHQSLFADLQVYFKAFKMEVE